MTDTIDNLVLQHLRLIRSDQLAMRDDTREIKNRLAALEVGQSSIMQNLSHLATTAAQQSVSFDRLTDRVERIEKRLELIG